MPEDVVLLGNYVAEIDADPELDPLLWRGGGVPIGHRPLNLHRAPHGIHHALELGKEPIAGVLYDPAPVLGDLRIDQVPEVRLEPLVGPLLICPHQARVPRHVGGEDCGKAASGGHR
jgi:hypothetical protein